MRLTTRGRYAVTALLDLAIQEHRQQAVVSLSDIAKRQSISVSYLEQLFSKLRRANLVTSIRGALGGYCLARHVDEISVMSIICAVDESMNAMQCGGSGNCHDGAMCLTHDLWQGLSLHIENYLTTITLAKLMQSPHCMTLADGEMISEIPSSMPGKLLFNSHPMSSQETTAVNVQTLKAEKAKLGASATK